MRYHGFSLLFFIGSLLTGAPSPSSLAPILEDSPVFAPAPYGVQGSPGSFDPGRSDFGVRLGDMVSGYRVLGMTVLPGETLPLEVTGVAEGARFEVRTASNAPERTGPHRWTWRAPERIGLYPIEIAAAGSPTMTLNVFVVVPYRPGVTRVNGYAIGSYPTVSSRRAADYTPPKGFIEVTAENAGTLVAPHFRLEQFLCKQGDGFPKYVVLREPLFVKLETVLAELNERGLTAATFQVMSGYRTPDYNHGLRNVSLSRHTWGDAADILVDEHPRDGRMDDLNRDGRVNVADAVFLRAVVESANEKAPYEPIVGGIGIYGSTTSHGPFVHVDARGFRARWGG